MAEKLQTPIKRRRGMQTIRKTKLTLLSFHDKFLNFKENIGISETSSQENRPTSNNKQMGYKLSLVSQLWPPAASEAQNKALAGTGSPTKELV